MKKSILSTLVLLLLVTGCSQKPEERQAEIQMIVQQEMDSVTGQVTNIQTETKEFLTLMAEEVKVIKTENESLKLKIDELSKEMREYKKRLRNVPSTDKPELRDQVIHQGVVDPSKAQAPTSSLEKKEEGGNKSP